jgi:ribonucleoside-diphosphate reductase alpha chain
MFKQKICFEIWGGENGKYKLKDSAGNEIDKTPQDTCDRVSKALSDVENSDEKRIYWHDKFKDIMGTKFSGGGRIMANAGSKNYKKEVSLINCVVSSQFADSMESIMDLAKEAALVLKSGCGIGYDFSPLRPKGAHVFGSGSGTSGVLSFMKVFDTICSTILSGGGRRGSQLGALDIQHPDIEDFIVAKRQDGELRYFNISALITDRFMNAVINNESWDLWFLEKIKD